MEKLKLKIKELIDSAKQWSLVEWIINFRYVGYLIMLLHGWLTLRVTLPDLIIFGGIIGLIERQVRKKK